MKPIVGALLGSFDVELTKVADLIYFEFSYLSLWRDRKGEDFLQYWCDEENGVDRWLIFGVLNDQLSAFIDGQISLKQLLSSPRGQMIYAVDRTTNGVNTRVWLTSATSLDKGYFPSEDSLYEDEPVAAKHGKRRELKVAIDGEWDIPEINQFPRYLRETYAFVIKFIYDAEGRLTTYPMNEGFSSMHLFGDLRRTLPREQEMKLQGVSYASPGAFNFEVDTKGADALLEVVAEVSKEGNQARLDYNLLMGILERENARGKDAKRANLAPELDQVCGKYAENLLRSMKVPNAELLHSLSGSGLMSAKIALAFFRLVSDRLLQFYRDERVQFPKLA